MIEIDPRQVFELLLVFGFIALAGFIALKLFTEA